VQVSVSDEAGPQLTSCVEHRLVQGIPAGSQLRGQRIQRHAVHRLPDRFGFDPAQESEWRDLLAALRRAIDTELTPRQREVFVAVALNQVPLDALVIKLGSNRNALYKMMFDARRKLRAALVANGYLHDAESRRS
jgi:DNA-directed RNA polymerase specialized sigma24 family protein